MEAEPQASSRESLRSLMGLSESTQIFVVCERTYDWADVRIAATLWGDWERIERRAREGPARFLLDP
jgi:hypothetical protein